MTKTAIIKIIDEVNAVILGLEDEDYKHFYEKFGIFVKNYIHMPKFKLGRWDGKARFFTPRGKTYVQLLEEIIPDLKMRGYKLSLMDNRASYNFTLPKVDNTFLQEYIHPKRKTPVILGDHQVHAINTVIEHNVGIIKAGTGAGKSIIAAVLCRLYKEHAGFKVIVIVPTLDLVKQTKEDIEYYGNDVGEYSGDVKELDKTHLVCTWQSLQNNKQIIGMYHVVIVDECHGTKSSVLREILNDYGPNLAVRIGLTGTIPPDPDEAMNVRISLGNVLYSIPAADLIKLGWLAKLKLRIIQLVEDVHQQWSDFQLEHPEEAKKLTYSKFKDEMFPDYDSERKYLRGLTDRNAFIVDLIETARARGNTFILTNGIPYGKKLASMIPNAYFIHGADKGEVRREIYQLFSDHDDIVVVTSFQLASTGLDIPRIFNMIFIDSGNSFIRVIQSIGRGLRLADDKDTIFVYDVCSDFAYSKDHCNKRKKYYTEEKHKFTFDKIDYAKLIDT
jgi:superfamily II DNA or RNA helicase